MATVPNVKSSGNPTEKRSSARDQLRKDRLVALVAILLVVGLMALTIWLASFGPPPMGFDWLPMMP
jgi:hypothetical protein